VSQQDAMAIEEEMLAHFIHCPSSLTSQVVCVDFCPGRPSKAGNRVIYKTKTSSWNSLLKVSCCAYNITVTLRVAGLTTIADHCKLLTSG
jgi:hypothetical protein